jgi:hypothetical protein
MPVPLGGTGGNPLVNLLGIGAKVRPVMGNYSARGPTKEQPLPVSKGINTISQWEILPIR